MKYQLQYVSNTHDKLSRNTNPSIMKERTALSRNTELPQAVNQSLDLPLLQFKNSLLFKYTRIITMTWKTKLL